MITKTVTIAVVIFLAATLVFSNNQPQKRRPALAGTWKLRKPKGNSSDNLILTFSITDPEVKIICKRIENGEEKTRELIYHADGKTETARNFYGDHESRAKT